MGSQHVLLTVKVSNEPKLSFGVRFDVDACVWQPKIDDENFRLEHKGTLMAMGYIQVSRVFLSLSPRIAPSINLFLLQVSKLSSNRG